MVDRRTIVVGEAASVPRERFRLVTNPRAMIVAAVEEKTKHLRFSLREIP